MRHLMLAAFAPVILLLTACGFDRPASRGAVLYLENCAICHGGDGRGGGGANVAGLSKTPIDLTTLGTGNGGGFPSLLIIDTMSGYAAGTHAGRRMTPFAALTSDTRRRVKTSDGRKRIPAPQADLLAYLETLQRE